MNKRIEKFLILVTDFVTINLTFALYYFLKVESGLYESLVRPDFLFPLFLMYIYWSVLFLFVGLYRTWFAQSRFEELLKLFKATAVGVFFLFFIILYDDYKSEVSYSNRFLIFYYWALLLFLIGVGRLFIRSVQLNLLLKGVGRQRAIIVGFNQKAHNIQNSMQRFKALGLDPFAYLAVKEENIGKMYNGIKVIDTYKNIKEILEKYKIKNVIIALEHHEDEVIFDVMYKCDDNGTSIKIVPDLYEIISGQVKTSSLYGFPLMDIMPQLMPEWEKRAKRILDLLVSFLILIVSFPVTIFTAISIKVESAGPILFKQERLGLNGKPFKVYKFRSMVNDAEKKSGPVWSVKGDPRITRVGRLLRKLRIDEIPQMVNIFKGDMSLVGPRPEREFFVEKLSEEIPLYKRRLKVRPGVTGWAQVKHKYDETIDDVRTKLRYDLFYIENMSLRLDMVILFRTVFVVLFGKGHFN